MLLNIPYKNGDVVSLKLSSGEEIIGRLEEEKGSDMYITKPMMIAATQEGLGLAPFMFSAPGDARFVLNRSNVLCATKSEEGFAKQYIEGTTGISV